MYINLPILINLLEWNLNRVAGLGFECDKFAFVMMFFLNLILFYWTLYVWLKNEIKFFTWVFFRKFYVRFHWLDIKADYLFDSEVEDQPPHIFIFVSDLEIVVEGSRHDLEQIYL